MQCNRRLVRPDSHGLGNTSKHRHRRGATAFADHSCDDSAIGGKHADPFRFVANFPAMDTGFLPLLAASHAVYLWYKAVPHR